MRRPGLAVLAIVAAVGIGSPRASASVRQSDRQEPWPPPGVHIPGQDGVTPARLIWDTKPKYTDAAMRARIQGRVLMHCVVKTDGTVGAVRVFKSLDADHGLDAAAVDALKHWRFAPGTKDGVAVPVLVFVEMAFALPDTLPPLEWPRDFSPNASPAGWTERTTEIADLRVRFSYPERWHVHGDDRPNDLIFAHDSGGARVVSIRRPREAPVRIDRRLSKAQLQDAVNALKPLVGRRDGEAAGTGQVEFADRLWFWVEAHLPTLESTRASMPPELAEQMHWESGRLWILTTTVGSQMVQVSTMLLYPRGMSASDMEEHRRLAGAEFAAILQRLSITTR